MYQKGLLQRFILSVLVPDNSDSLPLVKELGGPYESGSVGPGGSELASTDNMCKTHHSQGYRSRVITAKYLLHEGLT